MTMNCTTGYHPSSPMIETEQEFKLDNITMSLMWSQEIHDKFQIPVSYRVSVQSVMKATVTMVDSTWINITLLYNTWYNVSVEADFCGHTNTTMLMGIYHGKYIIISDNRAKFTKCISHAVNYHLDYYLNLKAWILHNINSVLVL